MEELLLDIARAVRDDPRFGDRQLVAIIHAHSARLEGGRRFAKKQLMPFYLRVKAHDPERWRSWEIDPGTERRLLRILRMKPRRTASGVATVTVITKPWTCSGSCVFCPSDVRMPKSYLHDEPACQRAERNCFDPYLQVTSRLRVLADMGHDIGKVELIVLGGTWGDYPEAYRVWFVEELFRALNDGAAEDDPDAPPASRLPRSASRDSESARRARYRKAGIANDPAALAESVRAIQREVASGRTSFNAAMRRLYGEGPWRGAAAWQQADMDALRAQQRRNETAPRRCVGLVVETRPDLVDERRLVLLRQLGCTKVQIGVQSLDQRILDANGRHMDLGTIRRAFSLLRLFGFKTHAHFMVNLPGATPESDKREYRELMQAESYRPDEVKLYPCALVRESALNRLHESGAWRPYDEAELVDVLAADLLATPPHTRISRMIRDFSSKDIVAGNKKANLRQLVEAQLGESDAPVREIRYRELGMEDADPDGLTLGDTPYRTSSTREHFLHWTTRNGKIAGFLRLSLPRRDCLGEGLPILPGEAMIREVHVYGRVASLQGGNGDGGAQHLGLGRKLVAEAERIARDAGYVRLNVISAVGTRGYYRRLGFHDNGLYQQKDL